MEHAGPNQAGDLKYCTFFGRGRAPNYTDIIKYRCYGHDVCCERGCCAPNYYDSWCFWAVVLGIVLGCYGLSLYCKRVERERQRASRAPVNAGGVDRLLETLISNYRDRLMQPPPNLDRVKEAPPGYTVALEMPKPQEPAADLDVPTYEEALRSLEEGEMPPTCPPPGQYGD